MLVLSDTERGAFIKEAAQFSSHTLLPRQFWDLTMLANGAFAPLAGFMNRQDYESVCRDMRLASPSATRGDLRLGKLWPIPIVLDLPAETAALVPPGTPLALRNAQGVLLAVLFIQEQWEPNQEDEAELVYGTSNPEHPGVSALLNANPVYVSGVLTLVEHLHSKNILSPSDVHTEKLRRGWDNLVGFQTRNPLHRAHVAMIERALAEISGGLLLHPVVGESQPGDIDVITRMACYRAVLPYLSPERVLISGLPLSMRMAGPREALWHAIIRQTFGCTHFVVGRDHAGPGKTRAGVDFYPPYAAQELVLQHEEEIGIKTITFAEVQYVPSSQTFLPANEIPDGTEVATLSGTQLRAHLQSGSEVPPWFTYTEVAAILKRRYQRPRGLVVFFTGLPSSGKSTLAEGLVTLIEEQWARPVTLLDGDVVRHHLSSELGFSKEHRDLNIRRIGFVAGEIARHGGICICAAIAPYEATRAFITKDIAAHSDCALIYVSTPLEVCETRDRKGLYAKARRGELPGFTGVSDPYEPPLKATLSIDTTGVDVATAVGEIFSRVLQQVTN